MIKIDDLERQNFLKIIGDLEKENDELLDIINEERYEKDENIIERKKVNHSIVSSSDNHQYEIKNVNISLKQMKKIYLTLCMSLFVTSAVLGSSTGYLLYKNQLLEEKLKREEDEDKKIPFEKDKFPSQKLTQNSKERNGPNLENQANIRMFILKRCKVTKNIDTLFRN